MTDKPEVPAQGVLVYADEMETYFSVLSDAIAAVQSELIFVSDGLSTLVNNLGVLRNSIDDFRAHTIEEARISEQLANEDPDFRALQEEFRKRREQSGR